MTDTQVDVIDKLVGIAPGSRLDTVRAQRLAARENAQQSYLALFAPADLGTVSYEERFAIAYFVAGLHRDAGIADFYRAGLQTHASTSLIGTLDVELERGTAQGPYGQYPEGPLSDENKLGLIFRVAENNRGTLGARLVAGLEHAHLLVFRPRDASPEALQALLDAGWSTTDIVTLSQLVSFLAFQIRVIVGLRALQASLSAQPSVAAPALSNA